MDEAVTEEGEFRSCFFIGLELFDDFDIEVLMVDNG
jgi:hypothetical protein